LGQINRSRFSRPYECHLIRFPKRNIDLPSDVLGFFAALKNDNAVAGAATARVVLTNG
jgi:hypothetical protein